MNLPVRDHTPFQPQLRERAQAICPWRWDSSLVRAIKAVRPLLCVQGILVGTIDQGIIYFIYLIGHILQGLDSDQWISG